MPATRELSVKNRWISRIVVAIVFVSVATLPSSGRSDPGTGSSNNQMQDHMVMATSADSFTKKLVALSPTGWTATASDQSASYPAKNAIDGNAATIWHSNYSPAPTALPHSITIDMHATNQVAALTYLPRQDSSRNGTIGQYSVSTSTDGTKWSAPIVTGTWADDKLLKTAEFASTSTRYIRLTALSEAGGRGPWSSAAEIRVLGRPVIGPALPRTGWTVTGVSQASPAYVASNVLDGDALTIWHTPYTGTIPPLPHSITIDMHVTQAVSGLSYLPRQDSSLNGTIGKYSVSISTDGTTWGSAVAAGVWANDHTQKYAVFSTRSARFVRLTALTESGNRGQWTSAAEINIHGNAPTTGAGGSWGAVIGFPEVPASAVMLPNNRLLTFSAFDDMAYDKTTAITKVAIYDLATGKVTEPADVNTNHQMFCEGLAILADGRVLINGGSNNTATTIYDPVANTWAVGPHMNIPRGYNADTTLSTGQVLTLGGSWYDSAGNKNGELYTPSATGGSWAKLSGVLATAILTADPAGIYRADNHPWLFAQSNGTVFQAGPSKQMNWITTAGAGTITNAGNRSGATDEMNGNAVMYDVGKILVVGGAVAYQDAGSLTDVQATNHAYTIDINGGPTQPVVSAQTSSMAYPRAFSNSVVLPDGRVLVLGGQQHPMAFTDTGAVLSPELWDPATGKFTVMAPGAIPRTYHSVALLLPDGRVFTGGGGLCGLVCTTNHPNGQIFSPPYLFNADGSARTRPVIDTAPATSTSGSTITVSAGSTGLTFALVRTSAVTHSVNNDQRRIPLTPSLINGTTYTLPIPTDAGTVLPGDYMLFALDAHGTPSIAKIINIQ